MIALEGVVHRYDGEPALSGVDLRIPDGEWLLLVGPNGSGKTTLARHCNALLDPDEGRVTVDGTATTEDPVAARTRVGMVFQTPRDGFVAARVGDDVAFGPENLGLDRAEIDRRVERALSAVDMADRADERVAALSGGEQARVAIAGALAMEPAHLVLDEPLTGLDPSSRRAVLDRLADLHADGTGIVFVTHDLRDVLGRADRVVGLREGTVVADVLPERARDSLADLDVRVPTEGPGSER